MHSLLGQTFFEIYFIHPRGEIESFNGHMIYYIFIDGDGGVGIVKLVVS